MKIKCWEIRNCLDYVNCPAYLAPGDTPCWEIKGSPFKSNQIKSCSICPVYLKHRPKDKLTKVELKRYTRQLMIDQWGEKGQERLKKSTVFLAGAGGLGSPVGIYLAVAGVGKLRICDSDSPEISNLNRQILHNDLRIGENKAVSAKKTIENLNPEVEVIPITERITEEAVAEIVGDSEIIVDCLDNLETRFILNKYAVENKIPFVYGAIYGFEGQLSFIHHPETFCLACLYQEAPPKEVFPVVGVTPGVIGCLEVVEVLKYLIGLGKNLKNKLLVWNGLTQEFRKIAINKNPNCEVCGHR